VQGAGRGGDATLWRRQVTAAPPPRAFGGLQLQRLLRLLSGRTPPTAPALCRLLLVVCTPQDAAADAASGGGARLLHARPQLACWWAGLEVARFLVSSRLRSPYGGPSHTFEALERFLVEAVAAHQAEAAAAAAAATSTGTAGTAAPAAAAGAGTAAAAAAGTAAGTAAAAAAAAAAARPRQSLALLLHTIEQLERHVANAYDGSLTLPPPPRQARSFFVTNRRVCIDWFARIRTHLLRAALYTRAPTSVVRPTLTLPYPYPYPSP
jgi:hypothetical protein